MPTPSQTVVYNFVSTASATYTIPQQILEKGDISVYFGAALQLAATYSITTPTASSYNITFSPVPGAGIDVMILRQVATVIPTPLSSGAALTAEDLNLLNTRTYLQQVDAEFYRDKVSLQYDRYHLNPTGEIAIGDLFLPILSTPATGEAPRVWAKDSTGAIIDYAVDPGGKTAAQLEIELAEATSTTSGSAMIGYWDGTAASTVKAALDKVSLPAISNTSNGAANISAWNLYENYAYAANTPHSVQTMIDIISKTIKSATASDSGSEHIPVWWTYRNGASGGTTSEVSNVASIIRKIFEYPTAQGGSPVTWLIYTILNMSGSSNQSLSLQTVLEDLLNANTAAGSTALLWHKWSNGFAGENRVRELLDGSAKAQSINYGDYTTGWNSGSGSTNTQLTRMYINSDARIGSLASTANYKTDISDVIYNLASTYEARKDGNPITPTQAVAHYNLNEELYLSNTGASFYLQNYLPSGPIAMKLTG